MDDINLQSINLKNLHSFFENLPRMQIQDIDDNDVNEINKLLDKSIFSYGDLIYNPGLRKKVKNNNNNNFIYGDNKLLEDYIENTNPFQDFNNDNFANFISRNPILSNEKFNIYDVYMRSFMLNLINLQKKNLMNSYQTLNKENPFFTTTVTFNDLKPLIGPYDTDIRVNYLKYLNNLTENKLSGSFSLGNSELEDNILNLIVNNKKIVTTSIVFGNVEILFNYNNIYYYNYKGVFYKNFVPRIRNDYDFFNNLFLGSFPNLSTDLQNMVRNGRTVIQKTDKGLVYVRYNDLFKFILIYLTTLDLDETFKTNIKKLIFSLANDTNKPRDLEERIALNYGSQNDTIIERDLTNGLIYLEQLDFTNLLRCLESITSTINYRMQAQIPYDEIYKHVRIIIQTLHAERTYNYLGITQSMIGGFRDALQGLLDYLMYFNPKTTGTEEYNKFNSTDIQFAYLFNILSFNYKEDLNQLYGLKIALNNRNFCKVFLTYYLSKINNIVNNTTPPLHDYFGELLQNIRLPINNQQVYQNEIPLNIESYIKLFGYLIVEYDYKDNTYYSLYSEFKTSEIKDDVNIKGSIIIPKTIDAYSYLTFYKMLYKDLKVDYANPGIHFSNLQKGKSTLLLSKEGTRQFIKGIDKQKTLSELVNFYFLLYVIDKKRNNQLYYIEQDDEKLFLIEQLLFKFNLSPVIKKMKTMDNLDVNIVTISGKNLSNINSLTGYLEKDPTYSKLNIQQKTLFARNMYTFLNSFNDYGSAVKIIDLLKSELVNKIGVPETTRLDTPGGFSTLLLALRERITGKVGGSIIENETDETSFIIEKPSTNYLNFYSIKELSNKPLDKFINEINDLDVLGPGMQRFHRNLDSLAKENKLNMNNLIDILPNELLDGGTPYYDVFNNTDIKNPDNFTDLKNLFDPNNDGSIFKNQKLFFNDTFSRQDLIDLKKITIDINNCFYKLQTETKEELCSLISKLTNYDKYSDLSNLNEDEVKVLLGNIFQKYSLQLEIYKSFAALMSYKKFKSKIHYKPSKEEDNEIFGLFKNNLEATFKNYDTIMAESILNSISTYPKLSKYLTEIVNTSI